MTRTATLVFIECQRCGRKAQRTVPHLPLPPEARLRCSNCDNRDRSLIKIWSTAGSSSARIVSFPKGKRTPHQFGASRPDIRRHEFSGRLPRFREGREP